MTTAAHVPSPQQQAVLDWVAYGAGSARVEAVAGAGKTSTLVRAVGLTKGSVAICAYNKKIAKEIDEKVSTQHPDAASRVRIGTFHSFGYSAWRRFAPTVGSPDEKKLEKLYRSMPIGVAPEEFESFAIDAVGLARQVGIGALIPFGDRRAWLDLVARHDLTQTLPDGMEDIDLTLPLRAACALLKACNEVAKVSIDFDDMIYQPLRNNVRMWANDWVLVDECQDLNPVRRALAKKMLRPGGRAVFVGDPRQAIYGFTGADADSFDLIASEFGTRDLPLTTTFRCPKRVVEVSRCYVGAIEAAPTAPEGVVEILDGQTWEQGELAAMVPGRDAILCRNTRPLIGLVYRLIRSGIAATIEGRAIGEGLLKLAGRWKVKKVQTLVERLKGYQEREVAKAMTKGKEAVAEAITDKVEALLALIEGLPQDATLNDLRDRIRELFEDDAGSKRPVVVLSTIHRAKGLEWDTVHWYGRDAFQPSKFARQDWQLEQENNLMYVAATRAQRRLVIVEVQAMKPASIEKEAA